MSKRLHIDPRRIREPEYAHLKLLLLWPIYLIVFCITERLLPRNNFHIMHHPLDDQIPFCEIFLLAYVFWYLYMVGSILYTLLTDRRAFRRQGWFMILTFGTASLIYLLYPTCQQLRPEVFPRNNLLTRIVGLLYRVDTPTNVCPSLHVCGAIGCALGLCDTKRFHTPFWILMNLIVTGLIILSTVFLKQHSVVDVFWGMMLSLAAYLLVYGHHKNPLK